MSSRPCTNSARLRQRASIEYASDTRAGSRLFQASSASRTFCDALSRVKGGNGGRAAWVMISVMCTSFSTGVEPRQMIPLSAGRVIAFMNRR